LVPDPAYLHVALLAAGRSRRFGDADKLLAELDGQPLILHAAALLMALPCHRRWAVCQSSDHDTATLLHPLGFDLLTNPDGSQTQSLQIAAKAAFAQGAPAILVLLADMPRVRADHIATLIATWQASDGARPITSLSGSTPMPPVIFPASYAERIAALEPETPARALLQDAMLVPADPATLIDIDTISDLGQAHAHQRPD
jgi:molybdenum cofactor cytidylyltransferase